uniref:Glycosyltransferase family 2 protein n=1 Tax=candidate division WOR-3 bacterium TaxID=2052148 RepID=A0A7V0Z6J5_UNCW3
MVSIPKVSILIPVYNRARIILETLHSAVNQTYKNIEIIVVDNKSTDNTFETIKEFAKLYPNVKVYQNEENIGPVRNWRKCLDYATGEYAKILWSDDLIAPTFIEKTLPFLTNNEDVGFVFTGTEIFNDDTGKKIRVYFIGETGIYDTQLFIESSLLGEPLNVPVSPGNALFRKKDLEKNILLDVPNKIGSDFKMHAIGNDALIYLLTATDYPKFAFINEPLSFFRAHRDSITISSDKSKFSTLYNIAKAHFVENYLVDDKLRRKFNSRLLWFILLNRKNIKIKKVEDFYTKNSKVYLNYLFLGKLAFKKLFKIPFSFVRKFLLPPNAQAADILGNY